jgi:hypothetical protein
MWHSRKCNLHVHAYPHNRIPVISLFWYMKSSYFRQWRAEMGAKGATAPASDLARGIKKLRKKKDTSKE